MPKKSTNNSNVKQHRTESLIDNKKSRTLEVIHTLKRIIDSVGEDENTTNDNFDHEKNDNTIQTSPNRDTSSRNDELHIFTKDVNLDEADQSFWELISMQTELDLPSYKKVDAEKDQDQNLINLDETDRSSRRSISTQTELDFPSYQRLDVENDQVLKLTRIIATQTSPSCNRNVVEIGCNTSNVVYSDVEVSCNLISFTNSKTEVDRATIKDKLNDSIHMESSSVEHSKVTVEGEDANENRELPFSGCKETLNIKMSVKSENRDSEEIPAKTTNNVARKAEKIMHEKACQVSLNISKNSDDKMNIDIEKHQEFTKSNNHSANSISVNNLSSKRSQLSIYDYNASCSSEEVTEYPENNVQNEDMVTSELKVEGISNDLIAAFELAAKRARNLREAVIIYHENLRSREFQKRNEETIEDNETSEFHDDQHYPGSYTSFISENEDKIKSERDAMCHFANNGEDFCGFSTCSSRDSSFDFERFLRSSKDDYFGIDQKEDNAVLSENERAIARSILSELSDETNSLKDVKSLMQLLVRRTQEEHALELIQSERNENDENFEMEIATNKTLALPAAIKETYLISREILIPLLYCVVCTVIFWFLQFSFRCESAK